MPIDPSIAMGIKAPQFESPVNMLTQMLQVQGAQQQNQLGQMKLEEHQRGIEQTRSRNALLGSFTPEMTTEQQVAALTKGGHLGDARTLAESSAKVSKEQRETEKAQLAITRDKIGLGAQILGSAKDQASYDAARQTAQQAGLDVTRMPAQFDPAFVQAKLTEALTAQEQIEQHWKSKGFDLEQKKFGEQVRHNKVGEGVAAGQLGVAQSRERREANAPRGQVVQTEDGMMLVDPRTGEARPVTAGGAPLQPKLKPLPPAVVKSVTEARDNATTMERLNSGFKDEFGGKGVFGIGADMSMAVKGNTGADQESVAFWKDYRKNAELVERHAMFGASLTPGEQASWRSADIAPGMSPAVIKTNLAKRAALAKKVAASTADDMVDAGHNEKRVRAIAGREKAAAPSSSAPNAFADAEKERRYQEWKRSQGK